MGQTQGTKRTGTPNAGDAELARAVRGALEWGIVVPTDRIQATVANGCVTLRGSVDLWSQYDEAERLTRNLAGVRDVENLLTLQQADDARRFQGVA